MQAAVMSAPGSITMQDIPIPQPGPGEVLLKVDAAALCGTDQRVLRGEKAVRVPIIGHEIAGTVVDLGQGTDRQWLNQRVAVQTVVGCGSCAACSRQQQNYCRSGYRAIGYDWNGGFAEYMVMPKAAIDQHCLINLPDGLPSALGALLEPISCCVNGLRALPLEGMDRVVIMGAGIIGVLNGLVAKARGVREVIMVNRSAPKLNLIRELGLPFDDFLNSSEIDPVAWTKDHTDGEGVDAVVTCASSKSLVAPAMAMLRTGGHLSLFAGFDKSNPMEPMDLNRIHYGEIHIHGANASVRRDYLEALGLLQNGKIDGARLVTHSFALQDFLSAVSLQADATAASLKILVQP